ncbi:unnamed protein product, partial [Scytosiphon promiscuus]
VSAPLVRPGAEAKIFVFHAATERAPGGITSEESPDPRALPSTAHWMGRTQKSRMGRPGGHSKSDQQQQRPLEEAACGKIIVRLRPVLKHELAGGEGPSASATERGGELKLNLMTAKNSGPARKKINSEGLADDDQQRQQRWQREQQPTAVFQLDAVVGPASDNAEVFAAAGSSLVDAAIVGGNALLLVA